MSVRKYMLANEDKVPEDYYSMTDIFKTQALAVNEKRSRELRYGSYNATKEYCKKHDIADMQAFWNENSDLMQTNMNFFAKHGKIAPVAHLIEMFINSEHAKKSGNLIGRVSFGIKKEYLKEYLMSHGKIIPKKKVRGRPKTTDSIRYNFAKLVIGEQGEQPTILKVRRNAVYLMFKEWCKINKVNVNTGGLMALQVLLEQYPCDGLPELKDFETLDAYKKIKHNNDESQITTACVRVDSKVFETSKTIIKNYNSHSENLAKPKLTLSNYISNALNKYNMVMPLKYSNPELNEHLIQQAERDRIQERMKEVQHGIKKSGN